MHNSTFSKLFISRNSLCWPVLLTIFQISILLALGEDASRRFSFSGPEIFPIDTQVALLHSADIDGDGLNDLIVVNNANSKINILYNETGKTNLVSNRPSSGKKELNELPPDSRFRIESIASEKRISAMVVEDLNGDGKPDIAYYGEPKELVVQYNMGTNGWSSPKRFPIDDGQLTSTALVTGDLNGDGLRDLVLLGENQIYILYQKPDHTFGEPEKLAFAAPVKAVQALDIDGDGKDDLLLVNWDSATPFRFRLQNKSGNLGPECFFTVSPIRSYFADNLEPNKKNQIVTIAQSSGRAAVSEFVQKEAEAFSDIGKLGQFQVLPLKKSDSAKRGIVWADLDGDHLPDLLVAEPESGQISAYLQQADGSLGAPRVFSTFTGVTQLAVSDNWSTNGKPVVFLLSSDERQIGITQMDEKGRLPFPTVIPFDGKPLAMTVGMPSTHGTPTLAVILDQDGKRSLVTVTPDGKSKTQKLSESFKSNPSRIAWLDVNQDGLNDLVVLIPYEKIKILLQVPDRDFNEVDVSQPGGSSEDPWMSSADLDGDGIPELLLAQKNFLRSVVLKQDAQAAAGSTNKPGWSFTVKDQINGASSSSKLVGATPFRAPGQTRDSIFLLDDDRKVLTLCERDASGAWQVVKNVPVPYTTFGRLQGVALGGANPNAIAFIGKESAITTSLKVLNSDRFEITNLVGKKLISIVDSTFYKGDVSVLKMLTGGDSLMGAKRVGRI